MSENDNEPLGIEAEVVELRHKPDHWLVEAIDHGSEGEIYRAIFSGPQSQERALAFAAREYGHNGTVMSPPTTLPAKPKPTLRLVPPTPRR